MNHYEELSKINVNDKIEKKGRFSYLSWAWAVDQLMRLDPKASWSFHEKETFADGTMMVSCTVIAFEKPIDMWLPVLNNNNKPIANPSSFDINTAMMRCLVKGIAVHGLGLYIYAGEDLPVDDEQVPKVDIPKAEMTDANKQLADLALYITDELAAGNDLKALKAYRTGLGIEGYHHDQQRAVAAFMDTSGRRKLKGIAEANPPKGEKE